MTRFVKNFLLTIPFGLFLGLLFTLISDSDWRFAVISGVVAAMLFKYLVS